MKKLLEVIVTYLSALAIAFIVFKTNISKISITKIDTLSNMILTVVVTLIGFLITSITVFIGLIKERIFQTIRKYRLWELFIYYLLEPIISGIILLIYILYIVFKTGEDNLIYRLDIIIFSALGTFFVVSVIRIGIILGRILKLLPHNMKQNNALREKSITTADPNNVFEEPDI